MSTTPIDDTRFLEQVSLWLACVLRLILSVKHAKPRHKLSSEGYQVSLVSGKSGIVTVGGLRVFGGYPKGYVKKVESAIHGIMRDP